MKQTQSGQAVTTFGIATNREWMTSGSERKKSAEFHEVVAWARLGELCHQYLRKGKLVYLEGYLKTRSWESPEGGGKRFRTEIVLQDMIMLEKRAKDGEDAEFEQAASASEESQSKTEPAGPEIDDNNIF